MKKILITGGVIIAIGALILFNRIASDKTTESSFTEVMEGRFEITVTNAGELLAEKSLEIKGPEIAQSNDRRRGGGRGGSMHAEELEIQDLVPEGTLVEEGDYIAQLDRTNYENTLRDALEQVESLQEQLQMKILDTAVTLTDLRDDIRNQYFTVEEAQITLKESEWEPPATVRQAEISLDKANRTLEQKIRSYELRVAHTLSDINNLKQKLDDQEALVQNIQDFLTKFTIRAPTAGMVIYQKEWNGSKRKIGSSVNPFDLVIATLPDMSSLISKTYVNEIDISKVKEGQKVVISIDALPGKTFQGTVTTIANIGEQLPNSDSKMFEVLIKLDEPDPVLRPSMTTNNKIVINSFENVVYIPTECVHTGTDSIPFVYGKNRKKQIVVLGEANDKNIVIREGLKPGSQIYLVTPENPEKFKLDGDELIASIKEN